MVDWNKILKSHVINSVFDSGFKRWGMRIQIFDKYDKCVTGNINFRNSFCNLIYSCSDGAENCNQCYRAQLREHNKYNEPLTTKCHAGLNMKILPIIVDEEYVGTIIGSGLKLFEKESLENDKYIKKLSSLGVNETMVEQGYKSLMSLNGTTGGLVNDLLKLVAGDIRINYKKQNVALPLIEKNKQLRNGAYHEKYKNIVFVSSAMTEIFDTVEIIKNSEKAILIEGETGTGKELLAAAIHYNSPRRDKVFIIQNCSAFNDSLLGSELFGHVKGSFTGAISDRKGLFQISDGGTLFLDEIGDMSLDNQSNLLRILENGTYYKVGCTVLQRVDVRIIAATNKDLNEQVEKGLFRKDLYYRINAIQFTMPPLRKRKSDIVPLLYYFLKTYAEANNTVEKEVSQEVIKLFESYDWPGNVRELKNQIERLIILSGSNNRIEAKLLPPKIKGNVISVKHERRKSNRKNLKHTLKTVERKLTETELKNANWNKTIAARKLGISRASLNNKIEKFKISRDTN